MSHSGTYMPHNELRDFGDLAPPPGGLDLGINLGRGDVRVPQGLLDQSDVTSGVVEGGCEAVAQRVRGDRLVDARLAHPQRDNALDLRVLRRRPAAANSGPSVASPMSLARILASVGLSMTRSGSPPLVVLNTATWTSMSMSVISSAAVSASRQPVKSMKLMSALIYGIACGHSLVLLGPVWWLLSCFHQGSSK
jgi:hypothetical protein